MTTVDLLTDPSGQGGTLFKPYQTLTANGLNSEFLFLEGVGRAATTAIHGPRSGLLWYEGCPNSPIEWSGDGPCTIKKATRLLLQSGAVVQFGETQTYAQSPTAREATVVFERAEPNDTAACRIKCSIPLEPPQSVRDSTVSVGLGWLQLKAAAGEKTCCSRILHVHLAATKEGRTVRVGITQGLSELIQQLKRPAGGDVGPLEVHKAMFRRELQVALDRIKAGGNYATVGEVVAIVRDTVSATAGLAYMEPDASTPDSHSPAHIEAWWSRVRKAIESYKDNVDALHKPQEQGPPWGDADLAITRKDRPGNWWTLNLEAAMQRAGGANLRIWLVVGPDAPNPMQFRWARRDEINAYTILQGTFANFNGQRGIELPAGAMNLMENGPNDVFVTTEAGQRIELQAFVGGLP